MTQTELMKQMMANKEKGLISFPVHLYRDDNDKLKKVPKGKQWRELQLDGVEKYFTDESKKAYKPMNGLGVATGEKNNLTVVDLDDYRKDRRRRHGAMNPDNGSNFDLEKFKELFEKATFTVRTISGGLHYYFQFTPELKQTQGKLIDIRSNGGFVAAPPTSFDGKSYQIEHDAPIQMISSNQVEFLKQYLYPKRVTVAKEFMAPTGFDEIIQRCLDCLGEKWLGSTTDWIKVAKAVKLHLKEGGLPMLLEWSRKSPLFKREEWVNNKYNSIKDEEKLEKYFNMDWLKRKAKWDNPSRYFNTIDNTEFSIDRMLDMAEEAENPVEVAIAYFDRYHYKIIDTTIKYAVVGSDRVIIYNKTNFEERYANALIDFEDANGKKKRTPIAKLWLQYKNMHTATGVTFEPDFKKIKLITRDGKLNIWRGGIHKYDPDHTPNMEAIQVWLDHIKYIWCKGDARLFNFTIGRFASILQRPTHRCPVNIVVKGAQGCGKSVVCDFIGSNVIGDTFYNYYNDMNEFIEGFNSDQEQALLVFLDEVNSGGAAWKKSDMLKGMTTRPKKTINHKYGAQYTVPDYANIIFATNNDGGVVRIEQGDRRYFMLECSNEKIGDGAYFDKLVAHDNVGVGYDFFHYLLAFDLSGFDERNIPETDWKTESMLANITPPCYALLDWLHNNLPAPYVTSDLSIDIDPDELWGAFCERYGDKKHNFTLMRFKKQVNGFLGISLERVKKINGKSVRIYDTSTKHVYDTLCKQMKIASIDDILENFDELKEKAGDNYMNGCKI